MKNIQAVIVCCAVLLVVGTAAGQNQASPPSAPSRQPQAAPQTNQQEQPPQTNQQAAPQGQAQTVHVPSIDEQVKGLAQELSLSDDQQTKVRTMLQDQRQEAMTIVNDGALSREDKILKLQTLRQGTIDKVRASLNDDQKKKLDRMLEPDEEQPAKQDRPSNPPPK